MALKPLKLRNLFLAALAVVTLGSAQAQASAAAVAAASNAAAVNALNAHRRAFLSLDRRIEDGFTELEFSKVYQALRALLVDKNQNSPYQLEDARTILRSAWNGGVFGSRDTNFDVKGQLLQDLGIAPAQEALGSDVANYREHLKPDRDLQQES
jgi:hypothetical protein